MSPFFSKCRSKKNWKIVQYRFHFLYIKNFTSQKYTEKKKSAESRWRKIIELIHALKIYIPAGKNYFSLLYIDFLILTILSLTLHSN